jgi:putative addiction module component (TIGR02574 family)
LPTNDRELLVARLLESIAQGGPILLDADDEAELHRRLELICAGQAKGHDLQSMMEGLRTILHKRSVA